ncbi:MAG: phosphatidate cytidylyltransferase [Acidiferrobacterales bacterium]|nr:phosphatidate cytidylyltransferase [Acidiferrobacterales bacterium]
MLRKRLITAAILVAVFIAGLFLLPSEWFVLLLLAVGAMSAVEAARIFDFRTSMGQAIFVVIFLVISVALYQIRDHRLDFLIHVMAVTTWLVILWLLITYPRYQEHRYLYATLTVLSLSFAIFAISDLMITVDNGSLWTLGMFAVIWIADIAAFFTGRRFGTRKLAPRISPGKTIEGLKGSLFAILAFGLVSGTLVWEESYGRILLWVLVCLSVAAFSVIGDLFFSMNKRIVGVKDSGTLLPGHGGVLDRIDSTVSAAPVYALCVTALFV